MWFVIVNPNHEPPHLHLELLSSLLQNMWNSKLIGDCQSLLNKDGIKSTYGNF
jgi:hypothetical protein